MFTLSHLRLLLVLVAMLTIPGWAALSIKQSWRHWEGLQRWIVAVGISIAFYPVLFYLSRAMLPFLTFGPYKMSALLLALAAVAVWGLRGSWREILSFDRLEWAAIAVFGMTLFTRFWIIRDQPYPAWSDSLHHTLLTQLTAVQGQLPTSLDPYFPVPLDQYHLGLYAISGTSMWLGQVPAHTALLWTAQMLNGLCGLGVYLVLDRKVGRLGAIVGATVVGLLSHQPAFYVNWGRFTQVASQTILLIAWIVTWETVARWREGLSFRRYSDVWLVLASALLNAAVFMLHFRVAAFYLPLLAISLAWELWQARQEGKLRGMLTQVTLIGLVSLLIVVPAVLDAAKVYVGKTTTDLAPKEFDASPEAEAAVEEYYAYTWDTVPVLAARSWLLVLVGVGALVGLLTRNKLVAAMLIWTLGLYLLGSAYRLGMPVLSLTNMGAILIMLYLPIGLILGSAVQQLIHAVPRPAWQTTAAGAALGVTLMVGFAASHMRTTDIEPFRYFVTPADVEAMHWIRENTPADALFAVNTFFWLPQAPHGTDAGYWIPYLAERQITAGPMLISLGSKEYRDHIIELSKAEEGLESDNSALAELAEEGVDYVYIGRRGDFSGPGLRAGRIGESSAVELVYESGGSVVYELSAPGAGE